ncbi:MAG: hypothetical protein JWM59_4363 [Verrucomicrobiales bacterium]|nr:hypothetical protein [Verrucomicrobiales bacterium]
MKPLGILCLCSALQSGCQLEPLSRTDRKFRTGLHQVVFKDGVSREEAGMMGQRYFSGCAGLMGIRDGGDQWIADGRMGYAGEDCELFIDKRTGALHRQAHGKTFIPPWE